ncbi:MAG: glycosyltransferase [Bacteroidota bacterium]
MNFELIIGIGFVMATVIQLIYWGIIFPRIIFHKDAVNEGVQHEVSIIICAKNEAENLRRNLPHILNQNYPSYEVIVVNDNSTDKTETILLDFQKMYPILRSISSTTNKVGKKSALANGIQAAKYKVLLLTDADCRPNSSDWLRLMQQNIEGEVAITLGYAPYDRYPTLLNRFIRYETVYTGLQYLSFALWGQPYMGVGRNLMYQKSLYYKVGGFISHEHIASGDDDLFIHAVSHLNNIGVVLDKRSFVYSVPKFSWRSLYRQKTRHLSTATSYRLKHKVLLGLLSGSHFAHYVLGTFTLIQGYQSLLVGGYLIRMSIILLVSQFILRKLDEKGLLMWIPVLDVMMLFYYIVFSSTLVRDAKNRW